MAPVFQSANRRPDRCQPERQEEPIHGRLLAVAHGERAHRHQGCQRYPDCRADGRPPNRPPERHGRYRQHDGQHPDSAIAISRYPNPEGKHVVVERWGELHHRYAVRDLAERQRRDRYAARLVQPQAFTVDLPGTEDDRDDRQPDNGDRLQASCDGLQLLAETGPDQLKAGREMAPRNGNGLCGRGRTGDVERRDVLGDLDADREQ